MGDSGSGYQLGSFEDKLARRDSRGALAPARMIYAAAMGHSWAAAHRTR